ncbi:Beta-galactosidase 5 [Hibiscus syriacus]|uniref:beta-galactosidase n=1 Tax=Hibiscus syriacus TaxID=106335 RepID=A0A6A2Z4B4_HIBSY|nr:Beta-galactosidase 5 [Hibiscus syriacus]
MEANSASSSSHYWFSLCISMVFLSLNLTQCFVTYDRKAPLIDGKSRILFSGGPFITTSYDYDAPIDEYGLIRQPKYDHLKELHKHPPGLPFNTAEVGIESSRVQMVPMNVKLQSWDTFNEDVNSVEDESPMTVRGLLEQLNITRDTSDYLWYTTSLQISSSASFLRNDTPLALSVQSAGQGIHAFINGLLTGSAFGTRKKRRFSFTVNVHLHPGANTISILSIAVGLQNIGTHFETWNIGFLGPVVLQGLVEGKRQLTWQKWSYKVGLKGEANNLGDDPLSLDMSSMGKGQIWINGQSIGRYWTTPANGNCSGCNYVGAFRQTKCHFGCGSLSQQWYHVPRSWLKPTQNLLVVFEEIGGDASKMSLVKRLVKNNGI